MNDLIPDGTKFEQKGLSVLEAASGLIVASDADFQKAGAFLLGVKAHLKDLETTFEPAIKHAFQTHKTIVGTKNGLADPFYEAEKVVKFKMADYRVESEKKAREDRLRLDLEAKKRAEDEKLLEAEHLEAAGKYEDAIQSISEPIRNIAISKTAPIKVDGISFRNIWIGTVEDIGLLIQAVASGKAPKSLLKVDESALGKFAASTQGNVEIPGVRFSEQQIVAGRVRSVGRADK